MRLVNANTDGNKSRVKRLPEDTVKELKKVEAGWFKRLGIEHKYPKRE